MAFQSTPSAWRETGFVGKFQTTSNISIHSLRMEGDLHLNGASELIVAFQSTPSAWRETMSVQKL